MSLTAVFVTFGVIFLAELPDKTMVASLVLGSRFRPLYVWVGVAAAFAIHVVVAVAAGSAFSLLPDRVVDVITAVLFAAGAVLVLREGRADEHADAAEADADDADDADDPSAVRETLVDNARGVDGGRSAGRDGSAAGDVSVLCAGVPAGPGNPTIRGGSTGPGNLDVPAAVETADDQDSAPATTGESGASQNGFWRVVVTSFMVVFVAELGDLTQISTANLAARFASPVAVGMGAVLALWTVAGLAIAGGRGLLRVLSLKMITRIAAVAFAALAAISVIDAIWG